MALFETAGDSPAPARRPRVKAKGSLGPWLAARILERLREQALAAGAHITEQALADHFEVSRTPVRLALAHLARAGAVEQRPNRGYFVMQSPHAVSQAEVAPGDEDKLYYRLADDRLKGRVGARVTETELVRKYRVPRARIAAVLSRMAQEGWLERLPGHGWAFQPMLDSVKAYEEGYRFRAIIEPAALRQPGYRLAPEAIARSRAIQRDLIAHNERYSDAQIFQIGADFHEMLVAGSGNSFLLDAIRRVNALRRLLEYRAKRNRDKIAQQHREHVQLLDLIAAGRLEQAARLMERHLDVALKTKGALVAPKKRGA